MKLSLEKAHFHKIFFKFRSIYFRNEPNLAKMFRVTKEKKWSREHKIGLFDEHIPCNYLQLQYVDIYIRNSSFT